MPMFQTRAFPVEACRMPLEGTEPSDGLMFFLRAQGLNYGPDDCVEISTERGAIIVAGPGDWILVDSQGEYAVLPHGEFTAKYETLR